MRRHLLWLVVFSLFIGANSINAAEPVNLGDTVIQYFEASKNGDSETIKKLIGGSFYNQRKVLLEENKDYPDFLRNYYRGAEFQLGDTIMKKGGTVGVVNIRIQFPNGNVDQAKLLLMKDASGTWKVVDEMEPKAPQRYHMKNTLINQVDGFK